MGQAVESTLLMGALCALIGLVTGLLVSRTATGSGYEIVPLYAATASGLSGAALWWLLVARRGIYRLVRGAVTGALAGVLGHYVTWYFQIVGANLCYWLTGGCLSSLGEPPINLVAGVGGAAVLAGISLMFLGWATIPLSVAAGGLLALYSQRRT
jgi:hypothetical protein